MRFVNARARCQIPRACFHGPFDAMIHVAKAIQQAFAFPSHRRGNPPVFVEECYV